MSIKTAAVSAIGRRQLEKLLCNVDQGARFENLGAVGMQSHQKYFFFRSEVMQNQAFVQVVHQVECSQVRVDPDLCPLRVGDRNVSLGSVVPREAGGSEIKRYFDGFGPIWASNRSI